MKTADLRIGVTSPTFSKHPELRKRLLQTCPRAYFNETGARLEGKALVDFLKEADGAIVALEPVTAEVLASLPQLKVIAKFGVGLNNLDQAAMERQGIALGWTPGTNSRSVAELTLAFALGLLRNVFRSSRQLAGGEWQKNGGTQLSGKTVGIIGCGHIGKELVALLQPFSVKILVHDILAMTEFCRRYGIREVGKEELLRSADVVTLHVPYDESTHDLISAHELALMQSEAILINTSRGQIVNEKALYEALAHGRLGGAAMDVFEVEPAVGNRLLELPHFVGTPHIGGNSREAVLSMGLAAVGSLERECRTLLEKSGGAR